MRKALLVMVVSTSAMLSCSSLTACEIEAVEAEPTPVAVPEAVSQVTVKTEPIVAKVETVAEKVVSELPPIEAKENVVLIPLETEIVLPDDIFVVETDNPEEVELIQWAGPVGQAEEETADNKEAETFSENFVKRWQSFKSLMSRTFESEVAKAEADASKEESG